MSRPAVSLKVLDDAEALGAAAAEMIWQGLAAAAAAGRPYVLGCPAGRSPLTTYQALARRVAAEQPDLSRLHIVMMDEYVEQTVAGWRLCPQEAHYSCRGFGEREIRQALNAGLPAARRIPREHFHSPDPQAPADYDRFIEGLGGVDLFLMASGASDGHVAFNPPGTPLELPTRIVELAETTRRDNLQTFPQFAELADVPRYGVSISPGAIMRLSKAAVMLLPGAHRGPTLRQILAGYDAAWPASVVNLCRQPTILADRAAADAMETA